MDKDPRNIALSVLLSWHKSSLTLDRAIEKKSQDISNLNKKDKNLCNALIFGVLRNRARLDYAVDNFSKIPLDKIKLKIIYILRIALFQIMYMDRVPAFAAINTAVELSKNESNKKTAGFVNAVLRNASKNHDRLTLPDPKKNPGHFLSIKYSLPVWLCERWLNTYDFPKTSSLCEQINTIPRITIRTNTLKTDRPALAKELVKIVSDLQPTSLADNGLSFTKPQVPINEMKAFKNGLFQIQDEAAQIVTHFLNPQPGENNLDACAGLGGKTGHIAQLMNNQGKLTAVDIEPWKLKNLDQEIERLGFDMIKTRALNILKTSIKDFEDYFDRVLVDAPCTGLGVMQRNPDTKWKRSIHDITRLCGKQKKILNAAANLVKPGGILVYAVCSCEPEENEQVIEAFLSKRKDFSIDKDFESDNYSILLTKKGFIKTYPETNQMDGFFAARLRRKHRAR